MAPMGTGGEATVDHSPVASGFFFSRSFGTDEGENGVGPNRRSLLVGFLSGFFIILKL